jgi:uncharacterized secreted protein with C-terminal beta-propeller domain
LSIGLESWITEDYKITHIDTTGLEAKRLEECKKYSTWTSEPLCRKLITWEEYCSANNTKYVPTYCYADSTIWEYLANQSWNFRDSFINRALWIGNEVFAVSNDKISAHEMNNWREVYEIGLK